MATNVETELGSEIGTHFGQMNIGDSTETQNASTMTFYEGDVHVGFKLASYFYQEMAAEELFFDSEDREEFNELSKEDLPEITGDVFCDVLVSMMDEISTHNTKQCNPEKCEDECDICELSPVPKILFFEGKVIRTKKRT